MDTKQRITLMMLVSLGTFKISFGSISLTVCRIEACMEKRENCTAFDGI
jgi:hypothetical protein